MYSHKQIYGVETSIHLQDLKHGLIVSKLFGEEKDVQMFLIQAMEKHSLLPVVRPDVQSVLYIEQTRNSLDSGF